MHEWPIDMPEAEQVLHEIAGFIDTPLVSDASKVAKVRELVSAVVPLWDDPCNVP